MDTLLSDFELSVTRLAELFVTPPESYAQLLAEWFVADQRPNERRTYYRLTYQAVEDLHRRTHGPSDLRRRIDDWLLEAEMNAGACEQLRHNARATTQYLDQHAEREMTVFPRMRPEWIVSRLRLRAAPQLFVQSGGSAMLLWIDCTETFRDAFFFAKCNATLWLAQLMGSPIEQVEVVHSATGRIVASQVVPLGFAAEATGACEEVHRIWTGFDRERELRR